MKTITYIFENGGGQYAALERQRKAQQASQNEITRAAGLGRQSCL